MALDEGWYRLVIPEGVDPSLPGIYQWDIDGIGTYVGRYTHSTRPLIEYEANVLKIIDGRPYRPKKPNSFRAVHTALHMGHVSGRQITLTILENCPLHQLDDREKELVKERGSLNGRKGKALLARLINPAAS